MWAAGGHVSKTNPQPARTLSPVPLFGLIGTWCEVRLAEPRQGVFLHHFQYRNRADTSGRLQRLCEMQGDGMVRSTRQDAIIRGGSGGRVRWAMLDSVYAQDWARVERLTPRGHCPGVDPRPWTSLVPAADACGPRWYAPDAAGSPR